MPFAGDAIEYDASDLHGGIVCRKSSHQGRRRLRLPRNVKHQYHRQAKIRSKVCGGATPPVGAGGPVEQAHDALDHQDVRALGCLRGKRIEQGRRHGPAIEVDARRADRRGVERGVDVIGAGFGRSHGDPATPERRQDRKRHRCLAGAGLRRGDDESARGHAAPPRNRRR